MFISKQNLDVIADHAGDKLVPIKKYLIQLAFILEDLLEFCRFIISVLLLVQFYYPLDIIVAILLLQTTYGSVLVVQWSPFSLCKLGCLYLRLDLMVPHGQYLHYFSFT